MKRKVSEYLKNIFDIITRPEMNILPANIAFYFVLALIPIFTIIILLASSFSISIDFIIDLVNNLFPSNVNNTIIKLIQENNLDTHTQVFNIIAFIVASNGTYAIVVASNTLYKVDKRHIIKDRIKAFMLLIIIVILLLFLIVVPILGKQIISLLNGISAISRFIPNIDFIYNILKWPLTFVIIYFNLKLIYTLAPSKQVRSEDTTEGAFFTTICWVLATAIFSFYINNFANYDVIYGNLSTLIILMIWLYALSFIFVLGMAMNAVKYHKK